ncbi:transcriptional regulator with XRE-family HTH domain [Pedobacter sp. CG_S7]|uniref:helix-turn-helix domain-containing protein n=1 Tax=Pedobacter sp. CG_S7 TaxID=3143930 RepID=UPI003392EBD9
MKNVGKNIRRLRQKKGWTLVQIAEMVKISVPAFSKIETGPTDINMSRLKQLANIFGVHVMEILYEEGKNPQNALVEIANGLRRELEVQDATVNMLQKKLIELYGEVRPLTIVN